MELPNDLPLTPGIAERKCSHWVHCPNGIITYSADLESVGGCAEGCCDYYRCRVCNEHIVIEYD